MIKDCVLKTNQPTFFTEVKNADGDVFATIKAKTRMDISELEDRTMEKRFDKDGKFAPKTKMPLYTIIRIRQALTGHEKCGWKLTEKGEPLPITEEVISVLPEKPFDYYSALAKAIFEHDSKWDENKEGISKN